MKIINPSVEIMHHGLEKEPILPEVLIEKVGRTCYKSEDKITDDSAAKFVSGLVKRGHEAMIEHYSLIFATSPEWYEEILADQDMLMHCGNLYEANCALVDKNLRPFLRFTDTELDGGCRCIISGNMRAWRDYAKACVTLFGFMPQYMHGMVHNYPLFFPEYRDYVPTRIVNDILIPISVSDLKGDFEHSVHHDITVKFICDRGVSHEIVRHRTASFAQESTRYCNYSLGKFGGEITVVLPAKWTNVDYPGYGNDILYQTWYRTCRQAEMGYNELLMAGRTPQEARSVLPNSLKTEVIMTGNLDCWDHFFSLRCAPDAHPDIQVVAKMAYMEFLDIVPERYGLVNEVSND